MSLIETCKRLQINPFEYLKDVLTRFPSAKYLQIDNR
ncbi:MAG: transposase domain-containing protein [Candidatus Obscuribacterales bacterium]|nr:transposase domain-containing protein [Candidatus Obscuribacterales bacterium]